MKILIVDDNLDLLDILSEEFISNGYDVSCAPSGAEALLEIEKSSLPDLILLDIRMPGMDGLQFLDQLEASHPEVLRQVPIVFNSAGKAPPDNRVSGFIDKMTDLDDFLSQIKYFVEMRPRHA